MKTYRVTLDAYRVVLVEANTEEESHQIACDHTGMGDMEFNSCRCSEISGKELETAKRHNKLIHAEG